MAVVLEGDVLITGSAGPGPSLGAMLDLVMTEVAQSLKKLRGRFSLLKRGVGWVIHISARTA